MLYGGLEAGGTKMVCAIATNDGTIIERKVFPTEGPDVTMPVLIQYFKQYNIDALGIGSFGPLDLDKKSKTYGYIMSTPKIEWQNFNMIGSFEKALHIPIALDTDVNVAALGEVTWGVGLGDEIVIYITVGTGVGVGVCVNGKPLHGLVHPEAGHIKLMKRKDDPYEGACPFHKNCFEGLASGPAIEARWGENPKNLTGNEVVWEMEADYIAQALVNYILVYSPNKIILWGGVMHQAQLFHIIREKVKEKLNGYINHPLLQGGMEHYIVPAGLGENPGILGAVKLAMDLEK